MCTQKKLKYTSLHQSKNSSILSRGKIVANPMVAYEHEAAGVANSEGTIQRPKAANQRRNSNYMVESLASFDSPTKTSFTDSGIESLVNIKKLPVAQGKKSLAKMLKIKPARDG